MRRIVRGIGRVLRGEGPEEISETTFHQADTETSEKEPSPLQDQIVRISCASVPPW